MHEFTAQHRDQVAGTLSGFDRLVFRGTLRSIAYAEGMQHYLRHNDVLLKDFGAHVESVSSRLKAASVEQAEQSRRPVEYLASSRTSKEDRAREIATRDGINEGLIAILKCVEPCRTFDIHRNREEKKLELVSRERKCLFLYHYWIDPRFGLMSARIQTWFPFSVQICMNGRDWLAQQMTREGLSYVAAGNCFPWIERWDQAQRLMDQQLTTAWPELLDSIAQRLNPLHEMIFEKHPVRYYWSTYQSEWAIDIVFRKPADLRRLYPRLIRHGITTLKSEDVMRYLGKPLSPTGQILKSFKGEITTNVRKREEGVRIKHLINGNSIKLYDKAFTESGAVLRAETTIQNGSDLRVYRTAEADPDGPLSWRPMRKGIADLHRRAELSRKAAERYVDAYAVIDDTHTLDELLSRLRQPTTWRNRRVRALRPFDEDRHLLSAISKGEFALTGFRNRDLQQLLFSEPCISPKEARRRSAWVTRQLRILRAHGLILKINGTHRYQISPPARNTITAILTALRSTIQNLAAAA